MNADQGIKGLLGAVQRRERLADAALGLARVALPAGLWIAAVAVFGTRLLGWPPLVVWACALPVPAVLAWASLRPRSLRKTARRVDEHYGLGDQLGSALEFRASPPKTNDPRTAELATFFADNAETLAKDLDAAPVVPLTVPAPRWVDGIGLVAVAIAMLIPPPEANVAEVGGWAVVPSAVTIASERAGVDMALAEPLRQNLRSLTQDEDEVAAIAKRMLEILDALEEGTMDRAEALAELEALEEALAEAEQKLEIDLDEDPGMLADTVRELADALQEHEITEKAGDAFEQKTPEEAEQAMSDAADAAEAGGKETDEALQKAMEEVERRLKDAAKKQAEQRKKTDDALDEAERRLRKENKRKPKDSNEDEERRLEKKKELEKRVEQLRRQQKREEEAQRRLDQLRRQAKDAARKGHSSSQRKRSMQKLSRSAADAARKARNARRSKSARDGLQEAKSFIRRAGKQGEGQNRRRQQFKRFSKAAKGKQGKRGKDGKGGKQGKSTLLVEGQVGDGQPTMMMEGEGQGEGQGQGQGDGDGQGEGQGQGQGQGQGMGQGLGEGMGEGSQDPFGADKALSTQKTTVRVKAKEGRGVSRAEVIRDSSQQGFATEAYRDVYTDYRGFAQSALDNEALPAARRRAIRRYYQLIQPRE